MACLLPISLGLSAFPNSMTEFFTTTTFDKVVSCSGLSKYPVEDFSDMGTVSLDGEFVDSVVESVKDLGVLVNEVKPSGAVILPHIVPETDKDRTVRGVLVICCIGFLRYQFCDSLHGKVLSFEILNLLGVFGDELSCKDTVQCLEPIWDKGSTWDKWQYLSQH